MQEFICNKYFNEAVFAVYEWKDGLSDEKILEKLLALNLEREREIMRIVIIEIQEEFYIALSTVRRHFELD